METSKITYRLIEQYIQGTLDEKAMHDLERQALNDPFLADALEGYTRSEEAAGPQLSLLQKQLEERIALQQEKKNTFHFGWQRISVAAAACLLFVSASILFWMKGSRKQHVVSTSNEKMVDVTLMDPDSARSVASGRANAAVFAKPQFGWQKFEEYLAKSKNSGLTGVVTVSFKVSSEGNASDIRVLKSSSEDLNSEAIRLIKEGPKWENPDKGEVVVKIEF